MLAIIDVILDYFYRLVSFFTGDMTLDWIY